MVDLGGFADKAKKFAADNPEKVDQGIERGGDVVDERTGNKYQDQVDQAQERARGLVGDGEQQSGEQSGDQPGGQQA